MSFLTKNIFELVFYSILGVIIAALFLISITQGFILQFVDRNIYPAFLNYIGALVSLIFLYIIFLRAKRVINVLSESDFLSKLFRN